MLGWRSGVGVAGTGAVLLGLIGCANFFPALDGSTDSSGNTGNGTTVTGSGPNAAYVLNVTSQTVYGYTLGSSGVTGVNGLSLGYTPLAAVVSRNGKYLYVAAAGVINEYLINTSTGALSVPSAGSTVGLLTETALDVSPDGQWLFGLDALTGQLDEFAINSDGTLTQKASAAFSVASGTIVPKQVEVAPSGAYIVAALGTAGEVVFSLNTSTGLVIQTQVLGTGSTQTGDNAIAIDSTSSYLFIARSGSGAGLGVYAIGSQGALSAVSGSPFPTGTGAASVVVGPSNGTVYVANRTDSTISEFTVGSGGVLTAVSGSPLAAGSLVTSLGLDSTGKYVLAANFGGSPDLSIYTFDATTSGKLDVLATTAVGTDPAGSLFVALTH